MCRCGKETVRVSSTLLFTLSYPESTGNRQGRVGPGLACGTLMPFRGRVGFVICMEKPWLFPVIDTCSEELLQCSGPGCGRPGSRGLVVGFQPAKLLATERQIWGLTFSRVVVRKTPEVWLN